MGGEVDYEVEVCPRGSVAPTHCISESRFMMWGIQGSRERRQSLLTYFLPLGNPIESGQRNRDYWQKRGGRVPNSETSKPAFVKPFSNELIETNHILVSVNNRKLTDSCSEFFKKVMI